MKPYAVLPNCPSCRTRFDDTREKNQEFIKKRMVRLDDLERTVSKIYCPDTCNKIVYRFIGQDLFKITLNQNQIHVTINLETKKTKIEILDFTARFLTKNEIVLDEPVWFDLESIEAIDAKINLLLTFS